ncbi:MAG: hypothetical protein LUE63_03760 [Lachnospiraceae bacterium]|nr:hypothetical protein [Lachnospiraceae bacterium]
MAEQIEFFTIKDEIPVVENTPYDDVFRTLLDDCPRFVIPLINFVFGTTYDKTEPIRLFQHEFYQTGIHGTQEKIIADSHFTIGGSRYHLECQSVPDGDMQIRMFRYDLAIGIGTAEKGSRNAVYTVQLPNSAVLYLRSNKNIPGETKTIIRPPDQCKHEGEELVYYSPNIKLQEISQQTIFEKDLYILVPFQLFLYEKEMAQCEINTDKLANMLQRFHLLFAMLHQSYEEKRLSAQEVSMLLDMTEKVNRNLSSKYHNVHERLGEMMGGQRLNYPTKEVYEEGVEKGIDIGESNRAIHDIKSLMENAHCSAEKAMEWLGIKDAEQISRFMTML